MDARAVAVRGEVELARIAARVLDQLAHAVEGRLRGDHEHVHAAAYERDRGEVLARVERQRLVERHVDRVGRRRDEERVAVGRRLGDEIGADVAARAGAVLDDDRLAERLAQSRRERPRGEIGDSTRRKSDDKPDRLARVLAERRRRKEQRGDRGGDSAHRAFALQAACFDAARGLCSRGRTSFATRVIWSTASSCVRWPAWPAMRKWPRPPTPSINSCNWLVTSSGVSTNFPSRVIVPRLPLALIMRAASFTEK